MVWNMYLCPFVQNWNYLALRQLWSKILKSLLFAAFCLRPRKRSLVDETSLRSKLADYQCQQRSTISSAGKMVSNQRSHYFETRLPRFGNTQPMEQTHREQRRDYASQNWRLLFTFARENGEQGGSAQSRVRSSDRWTKIAGLASCTFKRRASSHVVPRYISVSFGEEQPLLQREVPLLQFWESLSGQNMFSGAVICILGAKKIAVGAAAEVGRTSWQLGVL